MRSDLVSKPYYTLTEFAVRVPTSYSTAKRMVSIGDIKRVQLRRGGRPVVPHSELERLRRRLGESA